MSFAEEILKDSVVNKEGAGVDLATHCAGKILLLYFSAHWCPPCKDFTPKLARFYTAYHETKNFEVVYVSFDKDKLEFEEYYKEMPWLAVKYSERDLQESLSDKFQIEGVPTLVVLNATTGMVLNTDAYSDCLGDAEGARFPWKCELDDE